GEAGPTTTIMQTPPRPPRCLRHGKRPGATEAVLSSCSPALATRPAEARASTTRCSALPGMAGASAWGRTPRVARDPRAARGKKGTMVGAWEDADIRWQHGREQKKPCLIAFERPRHSRASSAGPGLNFIPLKRNPGRSVYPLSTRREG